MARGFLDEERPDDRGAGGDRGTLYVQLAAKVLPGVTGKARRFDVGTKQLFIPFSQMDDATRDKVKSLDAGAPVIISVSEWFAGQEGLI